MGESSNRCSLLCFTPQVHLTEGTSCKTNCGKTREVILDRRCLPSGELQPKKCISSSHWAGASLRTMRRVFIVCLFVPECLVIALPLLLPNIILVLNFITYQISLKKSNTHCLFRLYSDIHM